MTSDRQKLLEFLEKNGQNSLYDELYDENVDIDDFKKRHAQELSIYPGYVNAANETDDEVSDAPSGMSGEEANNYFSQTSDPSKNLAKYAELETQRRKDLAAKQKLADEYARSNDGSYFDKDNWAANDIAKAEYAKGNYKTAMANEVLGKIAGIADFTPFPFSEIGPTVRLGQDVVMTDKAPTDAVKDRLFEYAAGLIPVGAKGYEVAKGGLGQLGELGEKLGVFKYLNKTSKDLGEAERIQKSAEAAKAFRDNTSFKKLEAMSDKDLVQLSSKFNDPTYKQAIIDYSRLRHSPDLNEIRQAENAKRVIISSAQEASKNIYLGGASKQDALDKLFTNEGSYRQSILRKLSQNKSPEYYSRLQSLAFSNVNGPAEIAVKTAGTLGAGGIRKKIQNNDKKSTIPTVKERDAALDYVIDKYKRQWKAGFVPHGTGIEVEAYKKWLTTEKR